jgi:hypothetical protein
MTDESTIGKQNQRQFASLAKVKSGWGYPPQGVLVLDGDRLVFIKGDGTVDLDATLDRCKIWFPWYTMGTGFMMQVDRTKYSASFNKLDGSMSISNALLRSGDPAGAALGAAGMVGSVMDMINARRLCQQWKEALGG